MSVQRIIRFVNPRRSSGSAKEIQAGVKAALLTPGLATRKTLLVGSPQEPALAGCSHWSAEHCRRRYSTRLDESQTESYDSVLVTEEKYIMPDVNEQEGFALQEYGEDGIVVDQVDSVPSSNALIRPRLPTSMTKLNKLLSRHQILDVPEHEIEEKFVRGRGPGGQAINKTNSSVCLVHLPTGIRVQAQPTRSREQNRTAARHILRERLDLLRTTKSITGINEVSPPLDNADEPVTGRAAKKLEVAKVAGMYAKEELRAAKVRQRKVNRAKKHRKKKREMEEDEEENEEDKAEGV